MGLGRVSFFFLSIISISKVFASSVPTEWTIFFYVAGDEAAIGDSSRQLLRRLAQTPSLRTDGKVRVVAQWDDVGEDPNYRYIVGNGKLTAIPESEIAAQLGRPFRYRELDSGDAETLREFLAWGRRAYPARHYGLVLSGHSWGQRGMMQDFHLPGSDGDSMMDNRDIRRALERTGDLDFLLVDACIAGQLEVALELETVTKYFAGSSMETPYHSVSFDKVLAPFIVAVERFPDSDTLLEDYFLKPWAKAFLQSHSRHGDLVAAEGQIDAVDAFAIRTKGLRDVSRALKSIVGWMPAAPAAQERWRRLADDDANLDLRQFSESLRGTVPDSRIQELKRALGYPEKDEASRPIVVDFRSRPSADGAWALVQIDETARHRETAICLALKTFAFLNAEQADLLPEISKKGRTLAAAKIDCAHLAEDFQTTHPLPDTPNPDGGPHPLLEVFDHRIHWPSGRPGQFLETSRDQRITGRALALWIPRAGKDRRKVRLSLVGTERIEIFYSKTDSEVHDVPPYSLHDRFDRDALYVVEGHSNGAPFKHGLGILFTHRLEPEALRSYRQLRIRETGWPEFLFGP